MISLTFDAARLTCDLALSGTGGLATDDGLQTAVLLSLFTDRRALADDPLSDVRPGAIADRRGWWGDTLSPIEGDRYGSRLWLLRRAKVTEETRRRAQDYAREALAWLIDDGAASAVEVSASWRPGSRGWLDLAITVTEPAGGVIRIGTQITVGGS